jgi:FtsH-binding integral membrane protein
VYRSVVDITNPPVSPWLARALGFVLSVSGVITAWFLVGELRTPPASRAEPALFYSVMCFLGIITAISVIQGARMALSRRAETMQLPTPLLWFGAILLVVSACLQLFVLLTEPEVGDPWQVLLGLGGAFGVFQLIRKRSSRRGFNSHSPGA